MADLTLGTAQWGSGYGITNARGRIPDSELPDLIDVARKAGITAVDTAVNYGDAHQRLRPWANTFRVCTKVPGAEPARIAAAVRNGLVELGVPGVDTVLLHDWDALGEEVQRDAATALARIRDEGLCARIGVSAYDESGLTSALEMFPQLDAVQVPINALDQRLATAPVVEDLLERETRIQARSVVLQGLLAAPADADLSRHPDVERFHAHARSAGWSPLVAALAYVRSVDWIAEVVVGVTSAAELTEVVDAWNSDVVWPATWDVASGDPDLVDPRRWRRADAL